MGAASAHLGGAGSGLHHQVLLLLVPPTEHGGKECALSSRTTDSKGWPWLAAWVTASSDCRELAISALCSIATSGDPRLQLAAIAGLVQLSTEGHADALSCLMLLMKSPDEIVRQSAAEALSHVVPRGQENPAEAALIALFEDASEQVVLAALETVAMISSGCHEVIIALQRCLSREDWTIRRSALACLSSVADAGNKAVAGLLDQALFDENRWVRVAAIEAVVKLAWRGDREAIMRVVAKLSDETWCVRESALRGLATLAEVGDETSMASCAAYLEDPFPSVRIAALEALGRVAPCGHREAMAMAARRLKDEDSDVRLEAIEVIIGLAENGDANTMSLLARCAQEDEDEDVRDAAETGVGRL